jgi:hypothetical protein
VNVFIEVSALFFGGAYRSHFDVSGTKQVRHEIFNLLPDLRIIQRRHQFRLRYMGKATAQRTFHQIVIYHCRPLEGFQLSDEFAPVFITFPTHRAGSDKDRLVW